MISHALAQEFPPLPAEEIDARTKKAIELFKRIVNKASENNWNYVVLSGFAIDAQLGYISRNHKDVDFIIDKEDIQEVVSFLENEGHIVCESKKYGKELLRIDPIDKETTRAAHCDIHISFFDERAREVVLPMLGKEMRFTGNYSDIAKEKVFLGVKAKVLLPELLLKEKNEWTEKFGFAGREERNDLERLKIQRIMAIASE